MSQCTCDHSCFVDRMCKSCLQRVQSELKKTGEELEEKLGQQLMTKVTSLSPPTT